MLGLIFLCVMPVLGTRVGDIGQDTKMPPAAQSSLNVKRNTSEPEPGAEGVTRAL